MFPGGWWLEVGVLRDVPARSRRKLNSQLPRQRLVLHAVEGGELADLGGVGVGAAQAAALGGGDHQVLAGVLARDEFEDLGVVAGPLEQERAQRVGGELG